MGISSFVKEYLPPVLFAALVTAGALVALAMLARRGVAVRLWRGIVAQRAAVGFLAVVLLFMVAFGTFLSINRSAGVLRARESLDLDTPSNLITSSFLPTASVTNSVIPLPPPQNVGEETPTRAHGILRPGTLLSTNVIEVRPGATYRYSLLASSSPSSTNGIAQARLLWLNPALSPITWTLSAAWSVYPEIELTPDDFTIDVAQAFHTEVFQVPQGATRLQLEIRNVGSTGLLLENLKLSQQGVYIEPHPSGAQGAIAFSFDWESAMGGAVHSVGAEQHDVAAAAQHGLLMRQGADWLNALFKQHNIEATFYATGYNLLDGNEKKQTFSGNPTYTWASPKNGWASDYWLTHPWFSDDPFGNYKSQPAWYFGDQTRELLAAGHEIAPHTFAHIYVRGSNPKELSTDMDQWLAAARAMGVPAPTTFAFPWRSSNSLTKEFYDVLYSRGIRSVTRLYPRDIKDFYTLGNAVVYTDVHNTQLYPDMAVMPDFLLGASSANAGEEAGGAPIGLERGLQVIQEVLARRGTTSFWNHPEQLGDDPSLAGVKSTWTGVVEAAARARDNGRLWIATVGEITAYQRDVMSVTARLDSPGLLGVGGWKIEVRNDSGKELAGVTLTLPGDVVRVSSPGTEIQSVSHPDANTTKLSVPGQLAYPTRQLVVTKLKTGVTNIDVEWAGGQEPLP